ncbi:hypothetical protein E4T56_gene18147 [Termitomyces sp. T112]|nr:hypothetical protein E4T56_gene18147 [Termitomyces sp. T112]
MLVTTPGPCYILDSEPHQSLLIPHQNSGSAPVICVASASSAPTILTHGLMPEPCQSVLLPRNSSSTPPDLPGLARINLPWLSSQVPSAWNTSECLVVSAGNHVHLFVLMGHHHIQCSYNYKECIQAAIWGVTEGQYKSYAEVA